MLAGAQLTTNPVALAATEHDEAFVVVIVAEADLLESSIEVALTTPLPAADAVNRPEASTLPTAPVAVHLTPFGEPVTLAVNCCAAPTNTIAVAGFTVTVIPPGEGGGVVPPEGGGAVTVTLADADFVLSSTEVAVTVPVPGDTAVNPPLVSTVPTLVALHVTPWVEFAAMAVNDCVCPVFSEAVVGLIATLIADATRFPIRYVASSATAFDE